MEEAIAKLLSSTSGTGANLSSTTYEGSTYAWLDMSFGYGYASIGGKKVSDYLADAGLSATAATLKGAGYTIVFSGSKSDPGSVRGYYYTDPDDSEKMVVVSAGGATQVVDKSSSSVGYYASLMG